MLVSNNEINKCHFVKKNLNIQVLFCFIDCQTDKIMLYFSYNLIDLLGEASTQT